MKRRPGDVGLYCLVGMLDSVILEQLAWREGYDRLLAVRRVANVSAPTALLARHPEGADAGDRDSLVGLLARVVYRLKGGLDFELVGIGRNQERVLANKQRF